MAWLPDWITGYDSDNAAAADAADRRRADLDYAALQAGRITQTEADRRAANGYGADSDADRAAIDATFADSVKDNAAAISSGINNTLSFSLGKIFGAIPLSVWALGAVAVFFYMGGAALLKGRLSK